VAKAEERLSGRNRELAVMRPLKVFSDQKKKEKKLEFGWFQERRFSQLVSRESAEREHNEKSE